MKNGILDHGQPPGKTNINWAILKQLEEPESFKVWNFLTAKIVSKICPCLLSSVRVLGFKPKLSIVLFASVSDKMLLITVHCLFGSGWEMLDLQERLQLNLYSYFFRVIVCCLITIHYIPVAACKHGLGIVPLHFPCLLII